MLQLTLLAVNLQIIDVPPSPGEEDPFVKMLVFGDQQSGMVVQVPLKAAAVDLVMSGFSKVHIARVMPTPDERVL